ncbi:unnamed protein product [Urochloa humidicola]
MGDEAMSAAKEKPSAGLSGGEVKAARGWRRCAGTKAEKKQMRPWRSEELESERRWHAAAGACAGGCVQAGRSGEPRQERVAVERAAACRMRG